MIYPPQRIESDRLILKSYSNGDESHFLKFIQKNREQVARFRVVEKWVSEIDNIEEAKKYIKQMQCGWLLKTLFAYAIWYKPDNTLIGEFKMFHIKWKEKILETGSFLSNEYEGKLITPEMFKYTRKVIFEEMQFNKNIAICRKDNYISIFHMNKTKGFKKVSEKNNVIYYSLSKEDYFAIYK